LVAVRKPLNNNIWKDEEDIYFRTCGIDLGGLEESSRKAEEQS
jgi:hypothetical protein